MIASYLVDANRSSHPLEELALEHTGYKALTEEDVCGRGAKAVSFAQIPVQAALDYAGERSDLALQLAPALRAIMDRETLTPRLRRARASAHSGADGDRAGRGPHRRHRRWRRRRSTSTRSSTPGRARIYELSGEEFNINSPKKLGEILFDKMGLTTETLKRTSKTKAHSTAFEVLEELGQEHELPRLVLEWRGLMKLKGTYIDALPQLVNPETGRVHTCFNQAVAATGRLSSSDPNLQNIPIRTELGREIRRAFVAEPRPRADLRGLFADRAARPGAPVGRPRRCSRRSRSNERHPRSHRAQGLRRRQRPERARAAAPRQDHQLRAALREAGLHAGQGHRRVARRGAGVHRRLLRRASRRCAPSSTACSRTRARTGTVKTMFGRRRLVPDINNRNGQVRAAAERAAVNMPIQGTRRRHPQEGDDRRPRRAAVGRRRPRPHDPHRPRRAAVRSADARPRTKPPPPSAS